MSNNLRPLAAALGITLTIAAAGAVLATNRHQNHHQGPPTGWTGGLVTLAPDPPPTPTPWSPPIVHPATGVNLIWTTVPGHDQLLAAYDWSGTVRGSFTLPQDSSGHVGPIAPSADGQRLLITMPDDTLHVFAAQGADLGKLGDDRDARRVWAGDDAHICSLSTDQSDTTATLSLLALGAKPRTVTTLHWPEGDGGPRLAACDVASDLAVIVVSLGDDGAGHVVEIRVVRLSTGATLRDVHPPAPDFSGPEPRRVPGALWDATSSTDGKLLLVEPWSEDDMVEHPLDWQIADSVSGRVLAHVTASTAELVGDGRWLLTGGDLRDWHTGATIATPAGCCTGVSATQPGGDAMVVRIPTGPPPTPTAQASAADQPPPDAYVILHLDGRFTRLVCCGASPV